MTYTGRREIFQENFIYNVKCFDTFQETDPSNDIFIRIIQKDFNDVFSIRPKRPYTANVNDNDIIDNEYLFMTFNKTGQIQTLYPFKYVKKIVLVLKQISFTTYNYWVPNVPPSNENRIDTMHQQFKSLIPIRIIINNKVVEFNANSAEQIFELPEYGETNLSDYTDTQIIQNRTFTGSVYVQDYGDTQFELSSFPSSIDVAIDANNNFLTDYYKNEQYRTVPLRKNNTDQVISQMWFYKSAMANFRINFDIIQTIDYETVDERNLLKPQRIVKPQFDMLTLTKLLRELKEDKEEKQDDKDLLQGLKEGDIEEIEQQFRDKEEAGVTPNTYIEDIKKNIQI